MGLAVLYIKHCRGYSERFPSESRLTANEQTTHCKVGAARARAASLGQTHHLSAEQSSSFGRFGAPFTCDAGWCSFCWEGACWPAQRELRRLWHCIERITSRDWASSTSRIDGLAREGINWRHRVK